jgi:hypothetical protein
VHRDIPYFYGKLQDAEKVGLHMALLSVMVVYLLGE